MGQTVNTTARIRISAVVAAVMLVLGFFSINPAGAHALAFDATAESASRDCHSGDLNDCLENLSEEDTPSDTETGDEAQGAGRPFVGTPVEKPIERSLAIRCAVTQSAAEECKPYVHGLTLAANMFAEGSDYDDDLELASVNGRGGETMCFVGNRSMPCSKLFNLGGGANQQPVAGDATRTDAPDDEYEEQRAAPSPVGGCKTSIVSPC